MLNTIPINFKSETNQQKSIFNNSKPKAPAQMIPYETDVLELQNIEKQMHKKQKSQEKLQKITAYGTAAIGIGIIGSLIFSIVMAVKGAKGGASKNIKLTWDDIAKKENFPSLDDPCVNKKVREFIKNIKDTAGLSDDVMKRAGVDAPEQFLLMWGPSGTGKTFSAKLLAKELGAEYTEVQFADVSSPYVGQTAVEIKNVFDKLAKKLKKEPNKNHLIAFNEIDALLVPQEKCAANNLHLGENRTAFLNGVDMLKEFKNVKIVGTTNVNPESGNLDKASLSRIGNILKIDLPDVEEIIASLKFHMQKSEDVKNSKFFENNKSKIEKFAKELKEKKYAHRDIEDIAKKARTTYAFDLQDGKTKEFDLKYLEKAVETKGAPVGTIDDRPIWEKVNLDDPVFKDIYPSKYPKWLSKLLGLKTSKE